MKRFLAMTTLATLLGMFSGCASAPQKVDDNATKSEKAAKEGYKELDKELENK